MTTEQMKISLQLDKLWTKNTSPELNIIYTDIIQYLKYSDNRDDAIQNIQQFLNLSNPFDWAWFIRSR